MYKYLISHTPIENSSHLNNLNPNHFFASVVRPNPNGNSGS